MSKVSERVLDWQGRAVRYTDTGTGPAVVIFAVGEGALYDDLATALAARHRVLVFEAATLTGGSVSKRTTFLAQALAQLGISSCSVIGCGHGASLALTQALHAQASVQRLVLIAPALDSVQHPELRDRLREISTPTLILVGTRDRPGARTAGQTCREHLPTSHLVLVYEAGADLMADRREATLAPINEFLDRGEGFIVFQESQMIRP